MKIFVHGVPGPQGSKKYVGHSKAGHAIMVESSAKVKPWREAVVYAAIDARNRNSEGPLPLDGPLIVSMTFTFTRPRSHYRTGKNAHLLRGSAPLRPCGKPDLSKLLRSTEDALTTAGVWKDDARVVEYVRAAKVYANEDSDALDSPGAVITISVVERDTVPF